MNISTLTLHKNSSSFESNLRMMVKNCIDHTLKIYEKIKQVFQTIELIVEYRIEIVVDTRH
jgi:hypothetical protein